jgi:deoxyribodipyrimidine photo-lyase
VEQTADHLLTEPGEILTKTGTPYTVFTPFKRVWFEYGIETPQDAPDHIPVPADLRSEPLPTLPEKLGVGYAEQSPRVHGSEAEGADWLGRFLDACAGAYDTERDFPAHEGTSRLSAYLRMGVVSPRRVFAAARERRAQLENPAGIDTWLSELAWRDFYYQILWHFPHVQGHAFRPEYDDLTWDNDDELFRAWCEGRTGYPIVDAAQRQMNRQAWMHNRARMISASFLTKDLLNDWRRGEAYFMQRLVDGDQASNNGGWQWAAGTGTDAQPFFRIFNPVAQGEKFDPDGEYVKTWVPELARVPAKYVHKPWELSPLEQEAVGCVLGRDYPKPVVDHKVQREKALRLYRRQEGPE